MGAPASASLNVQPLVRLGWRIILRHSGMLLLLVLIAVLSGLLGVAFPAWMRWLLETLAAGGALQTVLLGGGALALYQALVSALRAYLQGSLSARVLADLRRRVAAQLLRLPLAWFDNQHSGELVGRYASDLRALEDLITAQLVATVRHSFQAQAIMLALVYFEGPRVLWLLAAVPPLAALIHLLGRRVWALYREVREASARAGGRLAEALQQLETVKGFRQEALELARIDEALATQLVLERRLARFRALYMAIGSVATLSALVCVVAWLGPKQAGATATLEPARVTSSLLYIGLLFQSVSALGGTAGAFYRALGAAERLLALFSMDREQLPSQSLVPPAAAYEGPLLQVSGLHFAYPSAERALLEGFDLQLQPGEWLALTGPNGSGKSTLLKLILGLLEAQQGRLQLKGRDVKSLTPTERRHVLAYVPQQPGVFSGTVRTNIAYAVSGADEVAITQALEAIGAPDLPAMLPKGLETRVGEAGRMLSGGQRQLVAIARAVLLKPSLLLLDEATSQLEMGREAQLFKALRQARPEMSVIAVLHRRWATDHFDRVLSFGAQAEEAEGPEEAS